MTKQQQQLSVAGSLYPNAFAGYALCPPQWAATYVNETGGVVGRTDPCDPQKMLDDYVAVGSAAWDVPLLCGDDNIPPTLTPTPLLLTITQSPIDTSSNTRSRRRSPSLSVSTSASASAPLSTLAKNMTSTKTAVWASTRSHSDSKSASISPHIVATATNVRGRTATAPANVWPYEENSLSASRTATSVDPHFDDDSSSAETDNATGTTQSETAPTVAPSSIAPHHHDEPPSLAAAPGEAGARQSVGSLAAVAGAVASPAAMLRSEPSAQEAISITDATASNCSGICDGDGLLCGGFAP